MPIIHRSKGNHFCWRLFRNNLTLFNMIISKVNNCSDTQKNHLRLEFSFSFPPVPPSSWCLIKRAISGEFTNGIAPKTENELYSIDGINEFLEDLKEHYKKLYNKIPSLIVKVNNGA